MPSTSPGVLFVNRNNNLGGLQRVVLTAMELVRERGYRPVVACPSEGPFGDATRAMGIPVVDCQFHWMQRTADPRKLFAYWASMIREGRHIIEACREYDIALLHPHGIVSALYCVKPARALGIPVLQHVHDAMPPTRFSRTAYKYTDATTTRFVHVSEASRRMLLGLGIPREKTRVIYNGVEKSFLELRPTPTAQVTGNGPHIGLIALIGPVKGHDVMLAAMPRILEKWPEAHLYFIGSLVHEDNRPYLDEIQRMAALPPLAGHVTFTGYQQDIPSWIAAMDVVALPSVRPEALPTAVLETMAMGRKVVGTNIGGTVEIIRDGETGRLVPPSNSEALAEAVTDLLALGKDAEMGRRAAEDVRERFSPARFGDDLARLYDEMLGGASTRC